MKSLFLFTLTFFLTLTFQLNAQSIYIHAGQVIDGVSDSPRENVTVIVENGQISVGYAADLVAVPGNPLDTMEVMERPSFVMKGGEIIIEP
jgi:Imidazolonepropionase and related amidohydrolases